MSSCCNEDQRSRRAARADSCGQVSCGGRPQRERLTAVRRLLDPRGIGTSCSTPITPSKSGARALLPPRHPLVGRARTACTVHRSGPGARPTLALRGVPGARTRDVSAATTGLTWLVATAARSVLSHTRCHCCPRAASVRVPSVRYYAGWGWGWHRSRHWGRTGSPGGAESMTSRRTGTRRVVDSFGASWLRALLDSISFC